MSLLILFKAAPAVVTPAVDPGYWRGTPWIGHPLKAYPTDGANR